MISASTARHQGVFSTPYSLCSAAKGLTILAVRETGARGLAVAVRLTCAGVVEHVRWLGRVANDGAAPAAARDAYLREVGLEGHGEELPLLREHIRRALEEETGACAATLAFQLSNC